MAFDHHLKIVATTFRAYFCCLDGINNPSALPGRFQCPKTQCKLSITFNAYFKDFIQSSRNEKWMSHL